MLSSTFTDLSEHRQRAIEAISKLDYMPKVMEYTGARADDDVIESSTAYVGVISLKYGQTPFDPDRSPGRLSITELEFNKAMQLDRPIVLFVMGDEHPDARGSGRHRPPPTGYIMKPCRWLDLVSPIWANSRRIKPAKDA